ncbi:alkaline phosphatase [Virgibacillus sp. YIM 98842]|uniref:alkaline phosphatase n=1 Tax=Virgibacillus sp. YIM 98842 TaxID=2663533 RepID=UPI0013DC1F6E|nr:alkaline phosphatase [Virgibacillus sp. YIM 98842]
MKFGKSIVAGASILALTIAPLQSLFTSAESSPPSNGDEAVQNVIFMIPDGYATSYSSNYRLYKEDGEPIWDDMLTGMMKTVSANNAITDSAAAGTAMATGEKTNNGMISMSPDGEELETILEASKEAGKSAGLVATSTITHATPAVFGSHTEARNDEHLIAPQYLENEVDVIFGGGKNYFLPESEGGEQEERHLINEFEEAGYQFVENKDELQAIEEEKVLGLFAEGALAPELERDQTDEPSLAEMTESAIDVLDQNEEGFFLMVEGSQIDWAGHANDAAWAMSDTEAFEEAVTAAVEFADQDGETLVVMAGDHDTGGMTVGGYDTGDTQLEILHNVENTGGYIAGQLNSERSNTRDIMLELANIEITNDEEEAIRTSDAPDLEINHIISNYAGVGWSSYDHTGQEVPLFAYGPESDLFTGLLDNTDIPKLMAEAMGISLGDAREPVESSIEQMQTQIDGFLAGGEITNDETARHLQTHLISIEHYEEIGSMDKAIEHMNGFKALLKQLKENELISENAYDYLHSSADDLIEQWG